MENKTVSRVVVNIRQKELKAWRAHFGPFGTKTEFERISGIPRQTLNRVLSLEKGEKTTVEAIRNYLNKARF